MPATTKGASSPSRSVVQARVREHEEVSPSIHYLVLECPSVAATARPGQFLQVRPARGYDPLLPRPLSVHRILRDGGGTPASVALLYRVAGRGTALLSERRVGDSVQVFGPLGNGFEGPGGPGRRVLVAGGMGAAPVLCLAEEGRLLGWFRPEDTEILYGGANAGDLVCEGAFRGAGLPLRIATDDGTVGLSGTAVDLLRERIGDEGVPPWIFAVGPEPMYAAMHALLSGGGATAWVSLERRMACGLGACRSCVVTLRDGDGTCYADACGRGPVFDLSGIVLDGMV